MRFSKEETIKVAHVGKKNPFYNQSCSITVVRPSMPETTALGAAMAAGSAEGVGVWSLDSKDLSNITTDTFNPCIREKGKPQNVLRDVYTGIYVPDVL